MHRYVFVIYVMLEYSLVDVRKLSEDAYFPEQFNQTFEPLQQKQIQFLTFPASLTSA